MQILSKTYPKHPFKRRNQGAALAEFGPVLFVFFIMIFVPLLDIISFTSGVATIALAANHAARQAGSATTRSQASTNMQNAGMQVIGGPLGAFAKITPKNSSGLTLNVLQIPINGTPTNYPAGQTPTSTQLNSNIYEYQVVASYGVSPILSFNGSGPFGNVPGLGKPATISFTSAAMVEHPDGLGI